MIWYVPWICRNTEVAGCGKCLTAMPLLFLWHCLEEWCIYIIISGTPQHWGVGGYWLVHLEKYEVLFSIGSDQFMFLVMRFC